MRIATLVLLFTLLTATLRADDWPQWLGPQRDGVWRETGIIDRFPKGGPPEKWRTRVGIGYAGPAVAAGKLYLPDFAPGDGVTVPADGFKGGRLTGRERLLCLDAKSGKEVWKADYPVTYAIGYPGGPRCTPAVDGDRVYALGAMGDLRCYDTANGKEVWGKNFPKDFGAPMPVWGFAAHPLIDGDKLICLAGGSDNRLVIAFNKKTGDVIWSAENCGGDFGYCPPVIFEFGGKRQLVIWHTKAVLGMDPETGKTLWRVPFSSQNALTAPTPRKVGDDGLFVTAFYDGSLMLKVGADKAEIVWKSKTRGERPGQIAELNNIICTSVVAGDHVYGVCGYGQLRCIEAKTGKPLWETMKAVRGTLTPPKVAAEDTPAESERWCNAFIVPHGDRFFLFNEQGDLIIANLSPKGYEELDRAHLIDPTNTMAGKGRKVVWVHPTFAEKCVIVRNDAEAVCYSLAR